MTSKRRLFLLLVLVGLIFSTIQAFAVVPVTGSGTDTSAGTTSLTPSLSVFKTQVSTGEANQVTGVYVPDHFAYPVVQQPASKPAFVSTEANTVTAFNMATQYGSLGMLAHNYLAGAKFSEVGIGDLIYAIYGDGRYQVYVVAEILQYQALSPNDPRSKFFNLNGTKEILSAEELFFRTYGLANHLILQTCIESGSQKSWGRLFVMAVPYSPDRPSH